MAQRATDPPDAFLGRETDGCRPRSHSGESVVGRAVARQAGISSPQISATGSSAAFLIHCPLVLMHVPRLKPHAELLVASQQLRDVRQVDVEAVTGTISGAAGKGRAA